MPLPPWPDWDALKKTPEDWARRHEPPPFPTFRLALERFNWKVRNAQGGMRTSSARWHVTFSYPRPLLTPYLTLVARGEFTSAAETEFQDLFEALRERHLLKWQMKTEGPLPLISRVIGGEAQVVNVEGLSNIEPPWNRLVGPAVEINLETTLKPADVEKWNRETQEHPDTIRYHISAIDSDIARLRHRMIGLADQKQKLREILAERSQAAGGPNAPEAAPTPTEEP